MHASLLVHFASFQLKGDSQAWLFITNPDLQWLVQVCGEWGTQTPRKQMGETHVAPPQPENRPAGIEETRQVRRRQSQPGGDHCQRFIDSEIPQQVGRLVGESSGTGHYRAG